VAAARDTASAARERAARERAAAGTCADQALAAAHLAAAAQADADATAAEAHAAAAEAAAAEHAAAGVRHREEAGKARELSRRFLEWDITASDAHTFGERVLRNEQPIAVRVGEGIAAAGGLREVPASKRYAAAS
jgi:hypothetical protein